MVETLKHSLEVVWDDLGTMPLDRLPVINPDKWSLRDFLFAERQVGAGTLLGLGELGSRSGQSGQDGLRVFHVAPQFDPSNGEFEMLTFKDGECCCNCSCG